MPNKTIPEVFEALEDFPGFYGSTVPKGSKLYVHNYVLDKNRNRLPSNVDVGFWVDGCWNWRFVFDTMPDGGSHNYPEGNIRCAVWFAKGKWEKPIRPFKQRKKYEKRNPKIIADKDYV